MRSISVLLSGVISFGSFLPSPKRFFFGFFDESLKLEVRTRMSVLDCTMSRRSLLVQSSDGILLQNEIFFTLESAFQYSDLLGNISFVFGHVCQRKEDFGLDIDRREGCLGRFKYSKVGA